MLMRPTMDVLGMFRVYLHSHIVAGTSRRYACICIVRIMCTSDYLMRSLKRHARFNNALTASNELVFLGFICFSIKTIMLEKRRITHSSFTGRSYKLYDVLRIAR
jgi:hypothetical protein